MTSRLFYCLLITIGSFSTAISQTEETSNSPEALQLTLEDIWASGKLNAKSLPGFRFAGDEKSYLQKRGNLILAYDITTGNVTDTILDGSKIYDEEDKDFTFSSYQISEDGGKFLLETESESIYRYSRRANYYVWNQSDGTMMSLHPEKKQMYPSFNSEATRVAFVADNDLYIRDLVSEELIRITNDGKYNYIINGASDWVYEEEFGLTRAFEWSPEGNFIAFIRFDEEDVPEFTIEKYNDDLYPEQVTFKYPKVGEKNADVSVGIFELSTKNILNVDLGDMEEKYIPRIKWSNAPERLVIYKMNRHQNQLELLLTHPTIGSHTTLLSETNPYYIDINDDITFLKTKKWFVWSSERSGYNHLYLYDMNGRLLRSLTSGEFDVTNFYGIDEKRERIYFQAADESPMTRTIAYVDFEGNNMTRLNPEKGSNSAQFSSTFDYWVNTYSTINSAPSYTVYDYNGRLVREIEDNNEMEKVQASYQVSPAEFFTFKTTDGTELNGYMIKPANFDPSTSYPIFMFQYGGPNSQQVTDAWKGTNYWWFQLLAQQGYLVACVDNRGTGARGQDFRKMTYLQLGHYETIDQIEAAKYLGSLPYTDASRIGIYGWSYGGYMSSLCILKGNDVFKAAIAVAPVTNWKWYDTIYTERYMRTEKENRDGYKNNSPVYFADQLKGSYLLVHGMADDNVHFQHTAEMANALIKANKQFDTYFYPNKNHGIYGGYTRLHLFTKMTNFIKEKI